VRIVEQNGERGFEILVGGGMGRTPVIGVVIREFLPKRHLLSYLESILRVYNLFGRRDNKFKARIKILVKERTPSVFAKDVEAEWEQVRGGPATVPGEEFERLAGFFVPPRYESLPKDDASYRSALQDNRPFANWAQRNLHPHKVPGYMIVTVSLKKTGVPPGDVTSDQMDAIAHLAAAVGVKLIVEAPVRTIETNVHGTEIVLKHGAKKGKLTMIFSTSEVYGKSAAVPFREDADLVMGPTTKHRWAYACSKALDEFLALAHWKETKQPVIVMRFFNTVGPRQTGQYGMVVPTFVRQALSNEPITVFGDGTQQRSFTYVGDVVGALLKLMVEPAAIGQVFNVGNPVEITIGDLAKKVKELCGSRSEIVNVPYEEAYEQGFEDMRRRVPDVTKIGAAIGWKPTISLEQVLKDVIEHFRAL
jgi:UDP-glucose 4-epimerase